MTGYGPGSLNVKEEVHRCRPDIHSRWSEHEGRVWLGGEEARKGMVREISWEILNPGNLYLEGRVRCGESARLPAKEAVP